MGLGIFAAIASILKNLIVKNFGAAGEDLWAHCPDHLHRHLDSFGAAARYHSRLHAILQAAVPAMSWCNGIFHDKTYEIGYTNYQRATAKDTFRTRVSAANKSRYESDEDTLAIEMGSN